MKKILMITVLSAALIIQNGCGKDFLDTKPSSDVALPTLLEGFENARAIIVAANRGRFSWNRTTSLGQVELHQFEYGERASTGFWEYLGDDFFAMGLQSYGMLRLHTVNHHCENVTSDVTRVSWIYFYRMIEQVNNLICNIDEIPGLTAAERGFLLGNALAYRGHYHHLLVQTYAQAVHHSPSDLGVPLSITLDSEPKARSTVRDVYTQIEKDLLEALAALETPGVEALTPDIAFANPRVIKGLLSRMYLCLHDWPNAIKYAREARTSIPLMTQGQYGDGFFTRNNEWMWASIVPATEANDVVTFRAEMVNANPSFYPAAWRFDNCINKHIVAAADPEDARFKGMLFLPRNTHGGDFDVTTRYDKYRGETGTAYDLVYMRGAEMLLNEAEALCMPGASQNFATVRTLLKELRLARVNQTYADLVDGMTDVELLEDVKLQRRMEFWGEGFRFHDLKRRGEAMDRSDNGNAQNRNRTKVVTNPRSHYWVYLIPNLELQSNPHMVQNSYDQDWQ
jgi:hypothetical protein